MRQRNRPVETSVPVETSSVIDDSILESYRSLQDEGQPDVVTEFIDGFLEDLPVRADRLRQAVDSKNPTELKSAAHALKGSAGSVGAVVVAGLCAQIEAIGRSGSAAGTEEILVQLEPEIARATSELAKLRRP